jgi:hypothetical protein
MRRTWAALALAGLLPLAACGDRSDPVEPVIEATGTWHLETIDGRRLPVSLPISATDSVTFIEGSITLDPDGTFLDRALLRIVIGGEITEDEDPIAGTWVRNGDVVVLTADEGGSYSVELGQGGLMRQLVGPFTFIYRRAAGT